MNMENHAITVSPECKLLAKLRPRSSRASGDNAQHPSWRQRTTRKLCSGCLDYLSLCSCLLVVVQMVIYDGISKFRRPPHFSSSPDARNEIWFPKDNSCVKFQIWFNLTRTICRLLPGYSFVLCNWLDDTLTWCLSGRRRAWIQGHSLSTLFKGSWLIE